MGRSPIFMPHHELTGHLLSCYISAVPSTWPVHYYLHGANGDFKIIDPLVLGHEAGGIVTAVGPEPASPTSKNANSQSRLKVGDRVAIECGHNCGGCRMCKEGRYNLCKVRSCPEVSWT